MEEGYFGENDTNHNCSKGTFSEKQQEIILIAMSIIASMSFLMCAISVCCVGWQKLYKHFSFRLASCQVLSSMMFSMGMIIQVVLINNKKGAIDHLTCEMAGFVMEYFMWVKLLFSLSLIFHFFFVGVFKKSLVKLELIYVFLSLLLPLLFVWIPFINNSYGIAGAWCWIRDWEDDCAQKNYAIGIVEQFVLWYGPVFIALTISVVVIVFIAVITVRREYYLSVNFKLNSETRSLLHSTYEDSNNHNKKALKQMIPLLVYPVIFYVLVLVPLVNRIYDAISSKANYPLALIHSLSIGSWGFFSSCALLIHMLLKNKHEPRPAYLETPY